MKSLSYQRTGVESQDKQVYYILFGSEKSLYQNIISLIPTTAIKQNNWGDKKDSSQIDWVEAFCDFLPNACQNQRNSIQDTLCNLFLYIKWSDFQIQII